MKVLGHGGPVCFMVPFCLSFGQAFGHLAPFKKQIEAGTGWGCQAEKA